MAKMLLDNDLGKVLEGYTSAGKHEYAVTGSIYEDFYEVTADQLAIQLEQNTQLAIREHAEWLFCACCIPHLAVDFSEEVRIAGFWSLAKEQPCKVTDTLRVLAAKGVFEVTGPCARVGSRSLQTL